VDIPLEFPWDLIVALGLKCLELAARLWIEHHKDRPRRLPHDRKDSPGDQSEEGRQDGRIAR
jgi:hypothetical protein